MDKSHTLPVCLYTPCCLVPAADRPCVHPGWGHLAVRVRRTCLRAAPTSAMPVRSLPSWSAAENLRQLLVPLKTNRAAWSRIYMYRDMISFFVQYKTSTKLLHTDKKAMMLWHLSVMRSWWEHCQHFQQAEWERRGRYPSTHPEETTWPKQHRLLLIVPALAPAQSQAASAGLQASLHWVLASQLALSEPGWIVGDVLEQHFFKETEH